MAKRGTTYQIVQVRYSCGELVEDTWPVLYAIAGQAIEAFNARGPVTMFEGGDDPEADYFVRELDANYIGTGVTFEIALA